MFSLLTLVLILESDFVDHFCNGEKEFVLQDRTRVDCLTKYHAVEYDWAKNWYQGIGQSLHYAMHTGRRGGLVLIIRNEKDMRYIDRAYRAIQHYNLPITLWTVKENSNEIIEYKIAEK